MYSLDYKIKTLSPVIITGNNDNGLTETFDYITGSSVLGMFAARFIKESKLNSSIAHEDGKFHNLFLAGNVIFSNAYPVVNDGNRDLTFLPTPLSVQKNKKEDFIINLAVKKTDIKTASVGDYARLEDDNIISYKPFHQMYFHHYRKDRLKRQEEENGIFNYDSLNEDQVFAGTICGSEHDLIEFKGLLGSNFAARIGRSRNTQYGEVEVSLLEMGLIEPQFDIGKNEILLTFTAPVILQNKFGFPDVSLSTLNNYLLVSLGDKKFKISEYFARSETVENYLAVWGFKKPTAKAISSGATYRIAFTDEIDEDVEEKLGELVQSGLGERKNEGYGRLLINYGNNGYFNKRIIPEKKYKYEKPTVEAPETVKQIFCSIAQQNILKVVENKAVFDVSSLEPQGLTTSTVGRLELMLKSSQNKDEFVSSIEKLRDTAKNKLKGFRFQNETETLLERLLRKNYPDMTNVFLNLNGSVKTIAEAVDFNYEEDNVFLESLYKTYWLTFFRLMRKRIKTGGK